MAVFFLGRPFHGPLAVSSYHPTNSRIRRFHRYPPGSRTRQLPPSGRAAGSHTVCRTANFRACLYILPKYLYLELQTISYRNDTDNSPFVCPPDRHRRKGGCRPARQPDIRTALRHRMFRSERQSPHLDCHSSVTRCCTASIRSRSSRLYTRPPQPAADAGERPAPPRLLAHHRRPVHHSGRIHHLRRRSAMQPAPAKSQCRSQIRRIPGLSRPDACGRLPAIRPRSRLLRPLMDKDRAQLFGKNHRGCHFVPRHGRHRQYHEIRHPRPAPRRFGMELLPLRTHCNRLHGRTSAVPRIQKRIAVDRRRRLRGRHGDQVSCAYSTGATG